MTEQTIGVRTERRLVRPFSGLASFEALFRRPTLTVGDGDESEPSTVFVEPESMWPGSYAVLPHIDRQELLEACVQAQLAPDAVDLVLLARGRTLRRSAILYRECLQKTVPEVIHPVIKSGDENAAMVLGDGSGQDILFVAVLNRDIKPEVMRASLAGTWLGLCRWRVRPTPALGRSFLPLTDEIRRHFALPADATSYVHIQGEDFSDIGSLSSAVQHFVDSDLLSALSVGGPAVRAITTMLVVELLTQLTIGLAAFASESDSTPGKVTSSALDDLPGVREFMERLAHPAGYDSVEFANMALNKPLKIAPVVQAAVGSRAMLHHALVEGA